MSLMHDQLTEWLTGLIEARPTQVRLDKWGDWFARFGDSGPVLSWSPRNATASAGTKEAGRTYKGRMAPTEALAFATGFALGAGQTLDPNECTAALEWLLDAHLNWQFDHDNNLHGEHELIGYVYCDDDGEPVGFRGCSQLTGQPVDLPGVFPASFDMSIYDE